MHFARLVIGAALAATALSSTAGLANAQPDVEAIVNTTCTYPQVQAALDAQAPEVATMLRTNALVSLWVQNLLNSPPLNRRGMIADVQGMPEIQQYGPAINNVAATCQNF